jgi:hypothetical protein
MPAPAARRQDPLAGSLIGGLVAMLSVLFVTKHGARAQLISSHLVPAPMIPLMAADLLLGRGGSGAWSS